MKFNEFNNYIDSNLPIYFSCKRRLKNDVNGLQNKGKLNLILEITKKCIYYIDTVCIVLNTRPYKILVIIPKEYPFKCPKFILYQEIVENEKIINILTKNNNIPVEISNIIKSYLTYPIFMNGKEYIYKYYFNRDYLYGKELMIKYDYNITNWSPIIQLSDCIDNFMNLLRKTNIDYNILNEN